MWASFWRTHLLGTHPGWFGHFLDGLWFFSKRNVVMPFWSPQWLKYEMTIWKKLASLLRKSYPMMTTSASISVVAPLWRCSSKFFFCCKTIFSHSLISHRPDTHSVLISNLSPSNKLWYYTVHKADRTAETLGLFFGMFLGSRRAIAYAKRMRDVHNKSESNGASTGGSSSTSPPPQWNLFILLLRCAMCVCECVCVCACISCCPSRCWPALLFQQAVQLFDTICISWREVGNSKKCSKTHWPYLCHTIHSLFTLSLLFYYTIYLLFFTSYFFSPPCYSIPLSVL